MRFNKSLHLPQNKQVMPRRPYFLRIKNEMDQKTSTLTVNEKERNLIIELREIAYGKVMIFMQDGQPIRIEEIRESKKLHGQAWGYR